MKVAYTNIESKIQINALLSDPLTIMLVCQGCLLSMLLYNIAAEVLANFINPDKKIKRIEKSSFYGLMHRKIKLINQENRNAISIKILEFNFGDSILNNAKWDKISEGIAKKFIPGTA